LLYMEQDRKMSKEILPRNAKGELHGYHIRYSFGEVLSHGVFFNGERYGYHVGYDCKAVHFKHSTGYYMGGRNWISEKNEKGYCYMWGKEII